MRKFHQNPSTSAISKAVFKNLTLCCVPSESTFKNAQKIMPKESIIITGDSRFDQILERCKKNIKNKYLPDYFLNTQNIIFGSYDINDENVITQSLSKCFPGGGQSLIEKKQRIILVPHETDNVTINRMMHKLQKLKFNICKYSTLSEEKNDSHMILSVEEHLFFPLILGKRFDCWSIP